MKRAQTQEVGVVVADPNSQYVERLIDFIRTSVWAEPWRVCGFTQMEGLLENLQQKESTTSRKRLYLLHEAFYEQVRAQLPREGTVCLLTETVISQAGDDDKMPAVCFKYQSLQKICQYGSLLLESEKSQNQTHQTPVQHGRSSKIVSIYSATGGAGKTTLAAQLARHYAADQQRVLYINLEWVPTVEVWFPLQKRNGFSRMLYDMSFKTSKYKFTEWIEYSDLLHCDYLSFYHNFQDRLDCTREVVEKLLCKLRQQGLYDQIILDLDSAPTDCTQIALEASDERLLIVLDELLSFQKTKRFLSAFSAWKENQKFTVLLNKYTGQQLQPFEEIGLAIAGKLPYIPAWKNANQLHRFIETDQYYRSLRGWLQNEFISS